MAVILNFNNSLDYIVEINSYGRFRVNRVINGEVRVGFGVSEIVVPPKIKGAQPTRQKILHLHATHIVAEKNIPILVDLKVEVGPINPGEQLPPLEKISNLYEVGETAWTTAGRILKTVMRTVESKKLKLLQTGFYSVK